jgi:hypothetical protein
MVFPKLTFAEEEGTAWALADHAGENVFRERWFGEMVKEGAKWHETPLSTHCHTNLNPRKMETVRGAEGDSETKDPFAACETGDIDEGPVNASKDAKAVVSWAAQHNNVDGLRVSSSCQGHFRTKFRFFRRIHFWMEKTVEKIAEHEDAKEAAKMCGHWDDENRFSFGDFVQDPTEHAEESFLASLQNEEELRELDRLQSSDQDQEECAMSTSDEEEDDQAIRSASTS